MESQIGSYADVYQRSYKPINSLADKAYCILEKMIVTLELPPGSIIYEADLSRQINIGRTPLREALHRLAKERLVSVLPRRGMIVSEVNILDQLELVEMRRVVDRLLASKAATRATPKQRQRLKEIAILIKEAASEGNVQEFMHLDGDFDQILGLASRNFFAAQISETLHAHCRRFWYINQGSGDLVWSAELHAAMINAVAEGDEAEAVAASDRLSDYVEDFTRSALNF
ncbi:MAG: GntR family transcriptional regulator [bacterium]